MSRKDGHCRVADGHEARRARHVVDRRLLAQNVAALEAAEDRFLADRKSEHRADLARLDHKDILGHVFEIDEALPGTQGA